MKFQSSIKAGKCPVSGAPGWKWTASQDRFLVNGWSREKHAAEQAVLRAKHLCQQTAALSKAWRRIGDTLPDIT